LPDQDGEKVSSGDLLGAWYLLYWYPMADTPGCTVQAEGLAAQIEAFDELGCEVLGASFDSPEANRNFRSKYRLPFRLLSDLDKSVARSFGAVGDSADAFASRIAHLVDPAGRVVRRYDVEVPEFFAELVLDDLEAVNSLD